MIKKVYVLESGVFEKQLCFSGNWNKMRKEECGIGTLISVSKWNCKKDKWKYRKIKVCLIFAEKKIFG